MKKDELQKELDIKKWLESEKAQKDLCSTYDFCQKCNKDDSTPCALAYTAFNKKPTKPTLSFTEKLAIAKAETRAKYCDLCSDIKTLNISIRVCKKNVTLRYKRVLVGLITLTKNSLKVHLALDPTLYQEITHLDYSEKKTYADVPFTIKLTSKKSIKNTTELLSVVLEGLN